MSTPDDATRRETTPGFTEAQPGTPVTTTGTTPAYDLDAADTTPVAPAERVDHTSSPAGPGLAIAGAAAAFLGLYQVLATSTVRECVPQPTGDFGATGVQGYLTALVVAAIGIILSAVGIAMSRNGSRWGKAVGVGGVVIGVVAIVIWLLAVWVFSAAAVDIASITSQEAALPLQGIGCAA